MYTQYFHNNKLLSHKEVWLQNLGHGISQCGGIPDGQLSWVQIYGNTYTCQFYICDRWSPECYIGFVTAASKVVIKSQSVQQLFIYDFTIDSFYLFTALIFPGLWWLYSNIYIFRCLLSLEYMYLAEACELCLFLLGIYTADGCAVLQCWKRQNSL